MKYRGESPMDQVLADAGVNMLTVTHLQIARPYQCACGWRGRTIGQLHQHQKNAKPHHSRG